MDVERIKELNQFTEEFNNKLAEAHRRYQENLELENGKNKSYAVKNKKRNLSGSDSKSVNDSRMNMCDNNHTIAAGSNNAPVNNKKTINDNLFKDPPAWKPNKFSCDYFEDYKKLNPEYFLNPFEIYRTHLVKRSYAKSRDLPRHGDFKYTKSFGNEFGEQKDLNSLSELGRSIISQFVKQSLRKEAILREKEQEIYKFKHSKPPVEYNKWKFSNHIMEQFGIFPGDKVHSFEKETKKTFLIKDAFRRPKRDGENFEKGVKLI